VEIVQFLVKMGGKQQLLMIQQEETKQAELEKHTPIALTLTSIATNKGSMYDIDISGTPTQASQEATRWI
jgi:hypothetical protein